MKHFFEAMENACQTVLHTGPVKMLPPTPGKMRWPREFQEPIDGVLHGPTLRDRLPRTQPPAPASSHAVDPHIFFG